MHLLLLSLAGGCDTCVKRAGASRHLSPDSITAFLDAQLHQRSFDIYVKMGWAGFQK